MQIFAEGDLAATLEAQVRTLRKEVYGEDNDWLLNVNETEYLDHLISKYRIEPLVLDFDNVSISNREAAVAVDGGRVHRRQVITYHIPFSGERDLLRLAPRTRLLWSCDVRVDEDTVSFEIINWSNNAERIRREAENTLSSMRSQSGHVATDIGAFNRSLESVVQQVVQARKKEILEQSDLLAQLGVPIRRAEAIPRTFSVPTIKRSILVKPSAPTSAFAPEPTLDETLYEAILEICRDAGVEMERHPSIYHGKDEETLRDHFLMVLAPHFQSVTGETFNRTGRTDILIRHERANVFVAECKIWRGAKVFVDGIDQVLRYLTWRDSKAAILCFVRNVAFGPVLQQIEDASRAHGCFVKYRRKVVEGWFDFDFCLPNDRSRSVRLAVLCFHFSEDEGAAKGQ